MHRFDLFRTLDDYDGEYVVWLWPSVVVNSSILFSIDYFYVISFNPDTLWNSTRYRSAEFR